jgi:cytoskeletal protein CcmA (bactofilin family)
VSFIRRNREAPLSNGAISSDVMSGQAWNAGYALPSVLFLIVLLTTLAFSALSYRFSAIQSASIQFARVKAEYAAQSGIAMLLSKPLELSDFPINQWAEAPFSFADQSIATVRCRRWGLFLLLVSEGRHRGTAAQRKALVAQWPSTPFHHALVFANNDHQLVLAGGTSITGKVLTGGPGISLRSSPGGSTTIAASKSMTVERVDEIELPEFSHDLIRRNIDWYNELLSGQGRRPYEHAHSVMRIRSPGVLDLGTSIRDEVDEVTVEGNVVLSGTIGRYHSPLNIVVEGSLTFEAGTLVSGLVEILATGPITIPAGAKIRHAILYSPTSITLQPHARISGQLISPTVTVGSHAVLRYPSLIASSGTGVPSSRSGHVILEKGSLVEGLVLAFADGVSHDRARIIVHAGATVEGAMYSEVAMTLDGIVLGTVITPDFHFVEPPTTYFGWLRHAVIDHKARRTWFLVPLGFRNDQVELEILEWL